jgi:hypothetical protein
VKAVKSSLADSADQVMFGVKTVLTDRGLLRGELMADTAFFFDNNTRSELRGVQVTFYGSNGAKNAVLTSREGTYRTALNEMEDKQEALQTGADDYVEKPFDLATLAATVQRNLAMRTAMAS